MKGSNHTITWQVIVLAQIRKADSDAEKIAADFKHMVSSILSMPYTPAVNIHIGILTEYSHQQLFDLPAFPLPAHIPSTSHLTVYRCAGNAVSRQVTHFEVLLHQSGVSFTQSHTLHKVFEACNHHKSFKHALLLTFDHGNGFGIFKQPTPANASCDGPMPYCTMDILADAIQSGFPNGKIDVLLMLNCFMMTMDTLYALQHQADYLVAPQTAICFYGFNYPAVLEALTHPENTPENISRLAVNTVQNWPPYASQPAYLSKLALFAADLGRYKKAHIPETENKLYNMLCQAKPEQQEAIRALRKQWWSVTVTASFMLEVALIDTLQWFISCTPVMQNPAYHAACHELKEAVTAVLGGNNPRIYKGEALAAYQKMPLHGVSSYLPFSKNDLNFACFRWYYAVQPSRYAMQSMITRFLQQYYGLPVMPYHREDASCR